MIDSLIAFIKDCDDDSVCEMFLKEQMQILCEEQRDICYDCSLQGDDVISTSQAIMRAPLPKSLQNDN